MVIDAVARMDGIMCAVLESTAVPGCVATMDAQRVVRCGRFVAQPDFFLGGIRFREEGTEHLETSLLPPDWWPWDESENPATTLNVAISVLRAHRTCANFGSDWVIERYADALKAICADGRVVLEFGLDSPRIALRVDDLHFVAECNEELASAREAWTQACIARGLLEDRGTVWN